MEEKEANGPLASSSFVPLSNNLVLEPLGNGHRAGGGAEGTKARAGVSARVGGGGMARPAVAELEWDRTTMSSPCFLRAVLVTTST